MEEVKNTKLIGIGNEGIKKPFESLSSSVTFFILIKSLSYIRSSQSSANIHSEWAYSKYLFLARSNKSSEK